jgi:alkanesulfonate monooxygenase SsuD/methylene tetrahydromethanopterin reductase-like flavin-dependent oxidoreductase (luciferase family)
MQVIMFHLMPYPRLPDDVIFAHDSYWVTMPNSFYDPKVGHEAYNRYLDELELCAELGFDGVAVNEHHQTPYGLMPSPVVTASCLARRTSRAKIAILGSAFCLREHPLTLAEEHAMIDNITGGRLISGFVRGIGAEYTSFGVNPVLSHERHMEAHDLIVQAWTRPGPFAFEGKHYHVEYVNLWPRPYQQPHPPIWCPSQGSSETIEWAAHPDRKYVYLQNFNPFPAAIKYLNYYREVAQTRFGYEAASGQLGWGAPVFVGNTDQEAMDDAREALEYVFNKAFRMPPGMFFPPGYTSPSSMRQIVAAKSSIMVAQKTVEMLVETGMAVIGSAETVRRRLLECHRQLGFGTFVALLHFGTLSREKTEQNIRRFAAEVLPALQDIDDRHYAGFAPAKQTKLAAAQ